MEANDIVNCIPERGNNMHNRMIKYSILLVMRYTTTMSTVLEVTSA